MTFWQTSIYKENKKPSKKQEKNLSHTTIVCRRCGDEFIFYPPEADAFIKERFDNHGVKWENFTRTEIESTCPYCKEVVYGKCAKPTSQICPLCKTPTIKNVCENCGCPLALTAKSYSKKSKRDAKKRWGHSYLECREFIYPLKGKNCEKLGTRVIQKPFYPYAFPPDDDEEKDTTGESGKAIGRLWIDPEPKDLVPIPYWLSKTPLPPNVRVVRIAKKEKE